MFKLSEIAKVVIGSGNDREMLSLDELLSIILSNSLAMTLTRKEVQPTSLKNMEANEKY